MAGEIRHINISKHIHRHALRNTDAIGNNRRGGDAAGRPFLDGAVAAVADDDVAKNIRCHIYRIDQSRADQSGRRHRCGNITCAGLRHDNWLGIDNQCSRAGGSRVLVISEQDISAAGSASKGQMQPRRRRAGGPERDGGNHKFCDRVAAGSGADEQVGRADAGRGAALIDGDIRAQHGECARARPSEIRADCKLHNTGGGAAVKNPGRVRCRGKGWQQILRWQKNDGQLVNRDFSRFRLRGGINKGIG